ncbi:related to pectinesterase [Phialocephala subalpina]|uniref:pectinesterase n=1 Tax=Phialocephala subalpina TaxID=576137 RepID=A0A1L7WWN0_9HELO|nr:related to pectinesterase [Phialocephala subalpina]
MARSLSSLQTLVLLFAVFLSLVSAWDISNDNDRHSCQAYSRDPLQGCDEQKTVFVDLVSSSSKYKTVQSAVASLPNNTDTYIILIASGNYTEQVNVTRRGPTYLLGQTAHPNNQSYNTVNIIWRAIAVTGLDNAFTSTLTVAPNLNASLTGSGPTGFAVPDGTPLGCIDFRTYNLNFINDFAPYSDDPSLALSISYANGGFYYTGFYSYQDTIYVGKLGNAYMHSSTIAGQTDFFYGFGTLWVQSCSVLLRNCGGGITAWKGTNTTFVNKYGVYIVDSTVKAANESIAAVIKGKCALGRPWNAQMRAIFARTYLDASILSTGFIDWNPARYNNYTVQAEYKDYGPGYNATGRAISKYDVQLSDAQWAPYSSPQKVFQYQGTGRFGNTGWIDWSV